MMRPVLSLARALAVLALALAPAGAFAPVSAPPSSGAVATRVGLASSSSALAPFTAPASRESLVVVHAVPKKGQSKMKTRQRKAKWCVRARARARALVFSLWFVCVCV